MTRLILAAALLLSACGPNTATGPRVDLPDGPGLGWMSSAAINSLPKPIPANMGPGSGGAPIVTGRGPVRTPLESLLVRAIPDSGRY
jgi:hypothetical protein